MSTQVRTFCNAALPQLPKAASDIQVRALGHKDTLALTGADGGPFEVSRTMHVTDPEPWAEMPAIRERTGDVVEADGDEDLG